MDGLDRGAATVRESAARPSRRFAARVGAARPRSAVALDALIWAVALAGTAAWLRAGTNARFGPLLGPVAAAARFAISPAYRRRVRDWSGRAWREVEAWAEGGGTLPWRAALAFAAGPFFLFEAANGTQLGTFDTRPVVPTAVSLLRDGDVDLAEFEGLRPPLLRGPDGTSCYCFQVVDGCIVSTYPPGMVPFALAAVAPAYALGADLDSTRTLQYLEKATGSAVAALALGLFFLTATRLGSTRGAVATTLFLATGSSLFTTVGLGLWQHGGVVAWLLAALLVEFAARGEPGRRGTAFQGFALAQMLSCRPTAALLFGVFGLWVLIRSPRRGLWLGLFGVLSLAPWQLFYWSVYHNLLGPATINNHSTAALWSFFALRPTLGVLFSPGRGIFVYQPWAILAVAGVVAWMLRAIRGRREVLAGPPGWRAFGLAAVTLHVVMIAAWWDWPGGYCYGSRLATDVVPLLALLATPAAAALAARRRGVALLGGLALAAFLVHVPCVAFEAHRWNQVQPRDHWSWSHAPFLYRR
ncbi:hypothetical protein [Paludisphaera mucosa]|uniref:Glycosyltransferase RgtA/B/C/D-like domain-containing protein n=1 Tax=Paludisphaera mucosa TaxID=3030827 RepID=A0ABT6FC22_9BACT|nr:hypothetical protein [Paludisphaera mucosa]MDG3004948.1 hypothetical protein [Paludisphaera mucosa]